MSDSVSVLDYIILDKNNSFRVQTYLQRKKITCLSDINTIISDSCIIESGIASGYEILLIPKRYIKNPFKRNCNSYLVLCDCVMPNGNQITEYKRSIIEDNINVNDKDVLLSFKQEFTIFNKAVSSATANFISFISKAFA